MMSDKKFTKFEIPKDGEPVYIVIRYGKVLLDGAGKPRVFYSPEHYQEHKKRYSATFLSTDRLVKYVPWRGVKHHD